MTNKPRRPWIAALLTLLTMGLGHLYAGNPKRGLILFGIAEFLTVVFSISIVVIPNVIFILVLVIGALAFAVFCVVDAVSIAKRKKENYELARYNRWFVYVGYVVILLFLVSTLVSAGIRATIVQAYKIPSGAMTPTLLLGDHLLVNKLIYSFGTPQQGDVVVFIYPEDRSKVFIKRVIGVGGDTIEIRDKKIFLNKLPWNDGHGINVDNLIIPGSIQPRDNFGPVTVPENSFFVIGDNRDESYDSRFWGFVPKKDVLGKAMIIYWSWNQKERNVRWNRINMAVQ